MLNELFSPQDELDLAWSLPKLAALTALLEATQHGTQPPRVVLLYGPTGCGKLASLKVLLRSRWGRACMPYSTIPGTLASGSVQVSGEGKEQTGWKDAAAGCALKGTKCLKRYEKPTDASGAGQRFRLIFHELHTCESTAVGFCQWIRDILSRLGTVVGVPFGGRARRTSLASALSTTENKLEGEGHMLSFHRERGEADRVAEDCDGSVHVFIVKFYGEAATSSFHNYTKAFIQQYEELRLAVLRGTLGGSPHASADSTCLLSRLRRNCIFFIHTTHDTHSEKMDLYNAFPSMVLNSSAVELFHCTPITAINMKKRLQTILRILHGSRCHDREVCSLQWNAKGADLPSATSSAPNGKRSRLSRKKLIPSQVTPLISEQDLNSIVFSSQGDIRQALLQTQWVILVPPALGVDGVLCAGAKAQGSLLHSSTGKDMEEHSATLTLSAQQKKRDVRHANTLDAYEARGGNEHCCQKNGVAARDAINGKDVLFISSSNSCSSDGQDAHNSDPTIELLHEPGPDSQTRLSERNKKACVIRKRKGSWSSNHAYMAAAPTVGGSSRSESINKASATTTTPFSLLNLMEDTRDNSLGALASDEGCPGRATTNAVASGVRESTCLIPRMVRDEYLGLSHATARLLTMKYTLSEVVNTLNVPPRKLLSYLTHNLYNYFTPPQLEALATCVACASDTDALRSTGTFFFPGSQYRRYQSMEMLMDRTSDEGQGVLEQHLDLMALTIFDAHYRVHHTDVNIPRSFSAQRPPPFLRLPYPCIREVNYASVGSTEQWRQRSWSVEEGEKISDEDDARSTWSEQDWRQHFLNRLELQNAPVSDRPGTYASGSLSSAMAAHMRGKHLRIGNAVAAFESTSQPLASHEMDILREVLPGTLHQCGSLDVTVLEYAPLAQYIVLDKKPFPSAQVHSQTLPTSCVAPSRHDLVVHKGLGATGWADQHQTSFSLLPAFMQRGGSAETAWNTRTLQGGNTKRTTFRLNSLPSSVSNSLGLIGDEKQTLMVRESPLKKRPCSELRYYLLKRGLPHSTKLREDAFYISGDHEYDLGTRVVANSFMSKEGFAEANDDEHVPLIPMDETVEEFSD